MAFSCEKSVYVGVYSGLGRATLPDNAVYEGMFEHGLFNGRGIIEWKDGDRYEGNFKGELSASPGDLA